MDGKNYPYKVTFYLIRVLFIIFNNFALRLSRTLPDLYDLPEPKLSISINFLPPQQVKKIGLDSKVVARYKLQFYTNIKYKALLPLK